MEFMSFGLKAALAAIGSVLLIVIIGVVIWLASGPTGWLGQEVRENSTRNRIAQQTVYEDTYAELQAAISRVNAAQVAYDGAPSDRTQTELSGAYGYCLGVVSDYNALGNSPLSEDYRPETYPLSFPDAACPAVRIGTN